MAGSFKYWHDGSPNGTVELSSNANSSGSFKFWFDGSPSGTVYETAAAGGEIKTVDGLAIASVKTINGLGIASVKTRNGLEP